MYKYEDTRSDLYKSLKKLGECMNAAKQYDKTRFSSAKEQRKWEAMEKMNQWQIEKAKRERKYWNEQTDSTGLHGM
jgi:hypothetical protein